MSLSKQIEDLTKKFNETLDSTMDLVEINNSKINEALKQQLQLELSWNSLVARAKSLRDRAEYETEIRYADAMKSELTDSYRSTTVSEAREFSKCNAGYKAARLEYLDASELYEDIKSALETVVSRRYILNNMTNLIVSASQNEII